jgi:hypothetical protein
MDLYRFCMFVCIQGLVVLSLIRGKVADSFDDIPLGLPPELVDFLKR